ncbi:MAG: D-alanyl-D-alanine carboxypeptidase [Lachnospiraceae bacterium]|nr:D-alanyl-D-alanine carboxypeptidase [Lachnospiraceae bacterium]
MNFMLKKSLRRGFARCVLIFCFMLQVPHLTLIVKAAEPEISAPSAVLMEASTGAIIYEKDADERRSPASITKIMTLLLVFESLEKGEIALTDEVVTSDYAQSMGGSQVFLEAGEVQTVETLIKCIAIASGNDASVAIAEYISGSEASFVERMNAKATELGLSGTHFMDCCGLSDSEQHYTTARDVAVMSRELITRYPEIFDYTTIWMEDIVHSTHRGDEVFTLSSTNKLLQEYPYTTGLKTGSTDAAGYCLSATAHKDGMDLIAVVMGADNPSVRFDEAVVLLEYGYSSCALYSDSERSELLPIPIRRGEAESAPVSYGEDFSFLLCDGFTPENVTKEIIYYDDITAPVSEGDVAGEVIYYLNGNEIGRVNIIFTEAVSEAGIGNYFMNNLRKYLL